MCGSFSWRVHRSLCAGFLTVLSSVGDASTSERDSPLLLFDDFSYTSHEEFSRNGWIIRSAPGWPGVPGAQWNDTVSFIEDPLHTGNRLVRMTAHTDGKTTRQAQFCHQRKYHEGTYAARVRFSDGPVAGPDGDQIVQTFYTIAPLRATLDPDYSEQDFEYLPNGGWEGGPLTLHTTTWETFRLEPWLAVNANSRRSGSLEGWHTLVLHLVARQVSYFLDGALIARHGEPYYPEDKMSINFNLWFIREGLTGSREPRSYQQDVDWVFHQPAIALTPAEVERRVTMLRRSDVSFRDTVLPGGSPLPSPCDF